MDIDGHLGSRQRSPARGRISHTNSTSVYSAQSKVGNHGEGYPSDGSAADASPRQPGQGGDADREVRDLRAELLKAEAAHSAKVKGIPEDSSDDSTEPTTTSKRQLENGPGQDGEDEEDLAAKRRRILEETRDIDADSDGDDDDSSTDER